MSNDGDGEGCEEVDYDIQDLPFFFTGRVRPIHLDFDFIYQNPNYENVSPPKSEDSLVTKPMDDSDSGYLELHTEKNGAACVA